MPMDRTKYPKNWNAIATAIKDKAQWTCEGCGKPCRRPGLPWATFVENLLNVGDDWYLQTGESDAQGNWKERPQRFTLTVAHLDHNPENCEPMNLKALWAPCHLRYDAKHHAKTAARARWNKRYRDQLPLFEL